MEIIKQYSVEFTIILGLLVIILLFWSLSLSLRLSKINKRFNRLMRGSSITNLEQVIDKYINEIEAMNKNINKNSEEIKVLFQKLSSYKGRVEIVRYNAFGEEGNDLSYSIAFIDDHKNGVVITSIYNRGESNNYAKPIVNGSSNYKLSKEELLVLEKAVNYHHL